MNALAPIPARPIETDAQAAAATERMKRREEAWLHTPMRISRFGAFVAGMVFGFAGSLAVAFGVLYASSGSF